jgi:pyruvate kinase
MARTKVVATIGPVSNNPDTIRKMLHAGMTVARVNFSHGDHTSHTATVNMLRDVADKEGRCWPSWAIFRGQNLD